MASLVAFLFVVHLKNLLINLSGPVTCSYPDGGWSSLKPRFWIGFRSFFPNLTFFCLDDFVVYVADTWAGS